MNDHPEILSHSRRCGGYPFTTEHRCHVGLAIAMTPRDEDEADHIWSFYGPILPENVPGIYGGFTVRVLPFGGAVFCRATVSSLRRRKN